MTKSNQVLIVEDDEGLQRQLKWSLSDYDVLVADNREKAIALIRRYEPEVVTLDLGLPPDPANVSEGFATLEEILSLAPETKVIVITGNDDINNAVKAVGLGAYDFYQKPVDPEVLKIIIERAFKFAVLEKENRKLIRGLSKSPLDNFITADPTMLKICRTIEKVAVTDTTVMLLGESGTGKEILAKAIHGLSERCNNNFVAINCAAIPENLLESELFGHEKGAFTGASRQTIGKIEMANNGSLFLDEIGDLPINLQAKLLRFLQERIIERVGGRKEIPVNVRVITATHQKLDEMIQEKLFREDLFYRLSEITVVIPPMREREGDTVLLAKVLLDKYKHQNNSSITGFTQSALEALESHSWPGNVRELENRVKRAVIMCDSVRISPEDLELDSNDSLHEPLNLREVREIAEKEALLITLNRVEGNISKAAELLGVSRPTLYDLLNKYGLK